MSLEYGKALVVDDEEINRALLCRLLREEGHEVLEAASGEQALSMVEQHWPDVILLDVMMPPPNGFEVCRQLKAEPRTAPIPVLLVTALVDREARLRGIRDGAKDFLSKPIDPTETLLRVRNAVRTKKLYDLSEQRFQRQRELEHLRESLIQMIVHDLKTPLTSMVGYARLLEDSLGGQGREQDRSYLSHLVSNGDRLLEMISSVLDVTRLESGELSLKPEPVSVEELLNEVDEVLRPLVQTGATLTTHFQPGLTGRFDRELIRRVLFNLGENGLRSLPFESGLLELSGYREDKILCFEVTDNGRGIPAESLDRIFDKFGQLDSGPRHTFGLGLAFCQLAVEAHGGRISVESELNRRTKFRVEIPC